MHLPIATLLKEYKKYLNKSVELCGWVHQHRRINERCSFVPLRDYTGIIQTVGSFPESCTLESVIKVNGMLKERPVSQINYSIDGGNLEIDVQEVAILNACSKTPPFTSKDSVDSVKSDLKGKYRFLDMRLGKTLQSNLRHRHNISQLIRQFLNNENFMEIETPLLFKCTPEGASEFIVSSLKNSTLNYALPQSPQQFKQMLMAGGIEKYFQFARCFRDEELSSDRQPEFTQLDLEMAFVEETCVMKMTENIMKKIFAYLQVDTVNFPLPVISYDEAMATYGTDSPDLRYKLEIKNNTLDIDCSMYNLTESDRVQLREYAVKDVEYSNNVQIIDNGSNLSFVVPRENIKILGRVRILIERYLSAEKNINIKEKDFALCWINNFPLFNVEKQSISELHHLNVADSKEYERIKEPSSYMKLTSTHHPFTALKNINERDPLKMIAKHYDLVLNGTEIGGGSIRIHNAEFQEKVFKEYLQMNTETIEKFSHLLTALQMGCPPHGGIALGFDRLLAILLNSQSIREVIAFPKNNQGYDALFNCPEKETKAHQRLAISV